MTLNNNHSFIHSVKQYFFVDIAVGAPFEEEGRGSVYIYNGYKLGLWSRATQRITAAEIDRGIRTFGISFSRPYDVDQNGYTGSTNFDSEYCKSMHFVCSMILSTTWWPSQPMISPLTTDQAEIQITDR